MAINERLKAIFPDYHPEDYVFSIASCCGSCKKGEKKTFSLLCRREKVPIEMFPYGICPQYERNLDIKMPVVMEWIKNNSYGNGQG